MVGYTEVARPAAFQNSCGGSMFTAVGNDSYSLADLTIAGPTTIANARNNYIMFLQSGTAAKIDKNRTYWYWQGIWRVRTGANPAKDPQLTAEEAAIWRNFKNGGANINNNIDYGQLSGAIWDKAPNMGGGNVYLDGATVGRIISSQQANAVRALERSGWQG